MLCYPQVERVAQVHGKLLHDPDLEAHAIVCRAGDHLIWIGVISPP